MTDINMKFKVIRNSLENLSWTIPLISGLILIISLITPAGYVNTLYYSFSPWWGSNIDIKSIRFWMWGFWNYTDAAYDYNRSYSTWLPPLHLSIGIMFTILIFVITILNLIIANKIIMKRSTFNEMSKLLYNCGLLLLIICVSWVILISFIPYYDILATLIENIPDPEDINALFWAYFKPDFGIIGPFIASGFLITLGRLAKR
ncbi:MAG: hypothetical protein ACFFD5_14620 [Candidatus Thorarchaeota archaeon]